MYAVIRAGGKQYRVAPGDVIRLEKFAPTGDTFDFPSSDVLAVSTEAGKIEKPNGSAATVSAQVIEEGRAAKILVFKFKRKKQYKKMQGHRQDFVSVRITGIEFGSSRQTVEAFTKAVKRTKSAVMDAAEAAGKVAGKVDKAVHAAQADVKKAAGRKPAAKKKAASKKTAAKKSMGKGKKK